MQNLVVTHDSTIHIPSYIIRRVSHEGKKKVSAIAANYDNNELLVLFEHGHLVSFSLSEDANDFLDWNLSSNNDNEFWFSVQFVMEVGSIICISRAGSIVSIKFDTTSKQWSTDFEMEGNVDQGVSSARWSPDQNCVVLATNTNTLLSLTNNFELINEIPIEPLLANSSTSISWRSDGQYFVFQSIDESDQINRIRIYSRSLELVATCRNIGEGLQSIVKNILPVVAYSSEGSLVATVQQRPDKKLQLLFFERTGLKHAEFDIQNPWLQNSNQISSLVVDNIEWNGNSTLLAVMLSYTETSMTHTSEMHAVQIYYKSNNHWYLKQQWNGETIKFHGFDCEVLNRLYLSNPNRGDNDDMSMGIRIIEMIWDTTQSIHTVDNTVAVIDGSSVLLTPFGKAIVPPPMSRYTVNLSGPCISVSFLSRKLDLEHWIMGCLSIGNEIALYYGDANGNPQSKSSRQVTLPPSLLEDFMKRSIRSIQCISSSSEDIEVIVACLASRTEYTDVGFVTKDEIVVISIKLDNEISVKYISLTCNAEKILPWANEPDVIGLAILQENGDFEVVKIDILSVDSEFDMNSSLTVYRFPEKCSKSLMVVQSDSKEENMPFLCFGISSTQFTSRLFCGDVMIASNVNSISYNTGLGVLLYVTLGSKPMLHFTTQVALCKIIEDIDSNMVMREANEVVNFDVFEPRPVERGSIILSSPTLSSVVVLQMPRGNLEGIEPRPLVLIKAKNLLVDLKYVECLQLVRRQRVDLNILVDHNPLKFMKNIHDFVKCAVSLNPEYISLLISSLEPSNVSFQKYYFPDFFEIPFNPNINATQDIFDWDKKVNIICESFRVALTEYLTTSGTLDIDSPTIFPLLCSYVKQRPPLLVEALALIKNCAYIPSRHSSITEALSSGKAQKCFKYMAFLCHFKDLFDAALGECDFVLAKAIARQSGFMDPKEYLPILDSFESIAKSTDQTEVNEMYCLMRYKVYIHLSKWLPALQWGVKCIDATVQKMMVKEAKGDDTDSDTIGISPQEVRQIMQDLVVLASTHNLHLDILPIISKMCLSAIASSKATNKSANNKAKALLLLAGKKPISSQADDSGSNLVKELMSRMLYAYGERCMNQSNFKEATAAFLGCSHCPYESADAAIRCARKEGDWNMALSIAGRYSGVKLLNQNRAGQAASISPQNTAKDIIEEYKSMIEQGHGEKDICDYFGSNIAGSSSEENNSSQGDRSREAAQLCIEYFQDVEGAVGILLLSRNWKEAALVASRSQRLDLLREEIAPSVRYEIKQMMLSLEARLKKQNEIIEKLRVLWTDGAARLAAISNVDPSLSNLLQGLSIDGAVEDSASEYGGGMSVYSNMSLVSNVSDTSSVISATSTVSMLSSQSMESNGLTLLDTTNSKLKRDKKSFAITGIEHSLLSRGDKTDSDSVVPETNENVKHAKRREKRRTKQEGGKDIWGLKKEGQMCKDLYGMGDVSTVATTISDISEVCLLLGNIDDFILAGKLQESMDSYTDAMAATIPPIAPQYPVQWLQRKDMECAKWFQVLDPPSELVWWCVVAKGLKLWNQLRKPILASYK